MVHVGIIGTGAIAREHAQAIALTHGHLVLSAAADTHPGRLQAFCRDFGVRSYTDAADLMTDPRIDLVTIATPPSVHEALAVAALDHGKFVVCEKPLAHSMASAHRIADAAARHPGRLTVSHQLPWHAPFRRLIWLCERGWIGTIESAQIERHSYIPHGADGAHAWWGRWDVAGGGVLITQAIHELDLLVQIMGFPARVNAHIDTRHTAIESEDHVDATYRFDDGRVARCVASVDSGVRAGSFAVRGTKGSIRVPWEFTTNDPSDHARAMRALHRALPDSRPPSASFAARGIRAVRLGMGIPEASDLSAHARLYLEVARSMASGAPLPAPPAGALGALELCMGAYESALSGVEVGFPLTAHSAVHEGVSKAMYDARRSLPPPASV